MKRHPEEIQNALKIETLEKWKLSDSNVNDVWIDYTLEVTEIKALKGIGGIIGIPLKYNTLARCFFSHPFSAKYSYKFHQ